MDQTRVLSSVSWTLSHFTESFICGVVPVTQHCPRLAGNQAGKGGQDSKWSTAYKHQGLDRDCEREV